MMKARLLFPLLLLLASARVDAQNSINNPTFQGTAKSDLDGGGHTLRNTVIDGSCTLTLPPATASILGAVKIGAGIGVTGDGTLSVSFPTSNGAGVQKGNGSGGFTAAVAGTDYVVPSVSLTTQGNVFNGPNELLKTDGSGSLTISGSGIFTAQNLMTNQILPLPGNSFNYGCSTSGEFTVTYRTLDTITRWVTVVGPDSGEDAWGISFDTPSWKFLSFNATAGRVTAHQDFRVLGVTSLDNGAIASSGTGALTASSFAGSGSSLTALNASALASGTVPAARMPGISGDVTSAAGTTATTVTKINGTALAGLGTGLLKNTTGTGIPSIAVAGTDYMSPATVSAAYLPLAGGTLTGAITLPSASLTSGFSVRGDSFPAIQFKSTSYAGFQLLNDGSAGWQFFYDVGNGQCRITTLLADILVMNPNGMVNVNNTFSAPHFAGNPATLSLSGGSGAGTSPTVSLSGTDVAGLVSVTTGASPTAGQVVATGTFAKAYASAPYLVLTPANAATAALSGTTQVWAGATVTVFTVNAGSAALAASTAYKWYYHVFQ